MLQTLVLEQEFIDKFTEEIIFNFAKERKEETKFEQELKRAKREVELEKLKQKFSGYGEQNKERQLIPEKNLEQLRPSINQQQNKNQIIHPLPKPLQPVRIAIPPSNLPTKPEQLNFFGKAQELINDNLITYIECPGENKSIIIKKAGMTSTVSVNLSNQEIVEIIKSFSERARIPLIEGMLNARLANVEISAVVSGEAGSSFIIKKNPVVIQQQTPTRLEKPMMQFPQQGSQHAPGQAMPPINRPFRQNTTFPPQRPPQQSRNPEQKQSFWNRQNPPK
ncbi:MAG: hypothetical protein Q8L27_03685 [archaeon]|nr:hypothetical protein [archaeon]